MEIYSDVNVSDDLSKKLSDVMLPDSVCDIGSCAFSTCGELRTVTLSGSVTNLGELCFFTLLFLSVQNIPFST